MRSIIEVMRADPRPLPCWAGSVPSVARYQCGSLGWSPSTSNSRRRARWVRVLARKGATGSSWHQLLGAVPDQVRRTPQGSGVSVFGGVDVAVREVLASQLRSEKGVESGPATACAGEHEIGHGVVVKGPHQHGRQPGHIGRLGLQDGRSIGLGSHALMVTLGRMLS